MGDPAGDEEQVQWAIYQQATNLGGDLNKGFILKQIDLLEQAVTVDPDFARAHHYLAVSLFWQTTRDVELRRALLPEVHRIASDAKRRAMFAHMS